MADFPGSGDRGTSLNGSESSAFGVNGRALDAPVAEVAALFAAEGERAVSYLCTSARPITFADVDALVERAFVQVREHWSDSRRYSRPVVFAFATLQRALTGQLPIGSGTPDAVVQSTVAAAGKGDLARVIALQN